MGTQQINILNNNKKQIVEEGTPLYTVAKKCEEYLKEKILVAIVNNNVCDLNYEIHSNSQIEFKDITSKYGLRTYQSSCIFILTAVIFDLFGSKAECWVEHSINNNLYCTLNNVEASEKNIALIKKTMKEYIKNNYKIESLTMPVEDCFEIFKENDMLSRLKSMRYVKSGVATLYKLKDYYDFYDDKIVPFTSYIDLFDIKKFNDGFLLVVKNPNKPNELNSVEEYPKLTSIFNEYEEWSRILHISALPGLNKMICEGQSKEIIFVAEALQEKKIAEIADQIHKSGRKIVLIAGPSSSGKTTFSHRLAIQLTVNGQKPQVISLDDYYKDREEIPVDENGKQNFENLSSIDVKQFNQDLLKLLNYEAVETPLYDMTTGSRSDETKRIKLDSKSVLIVEGIHGINEKLTPEISKKDKFKIYISALTQLNVDEHNRIATTDNRLIRRIVRDHYFRGFEANATINMWKDVLTGEEENIFPYQEQADAMFNSALTYELCVLKVLVEPLLFKIEKADSAYVEARRLLKFLDGFIALPENYVPANSLLREFIGHCCFYDEF